MSVSKDVIRDLLPVYAAGEASADTRALVEEFLSRDPELRAVVDAASKFQAPAALPGGGIHSLEVETLNRTRRLLARKSFVLGIALLFTLLPMTIVIHKWEIVILLARDYPDAASGLLLNAAVAWIVYLDTCRRLRATGLEGPHSLWAKLRWCLVGLALGVPTMLVAQHWAGDHWWPLVFPPLFIGIAFALSVYWARKLTS